VILQRVGMGGAWGVSVPGGSAGLRWAASPLLDRGHRPAFFRKASQPGAASLFGALRKRGLNPTRAEVDPGATGAQRGKGTVKKGKAKNGRRERPCNSPGEHVPGVNNPYWRTEVGGNPQAAASGAPVPWDRRECGLSAGRAGDCSPLALLRTALPMRQPSRARSESSSGVSGGPLTPLEDSLHARLGCRIGSAAVINDSALPGKNVPALWAAGRSVRGWIPAAVPPT
jgi:hypothetical protein